VNLNSLSSFIVKIFLYIFILFLSGCTTEFQVNSPFNTYEVKNKTIEAYVKRVIDGDTILVSIQNHKEERVRMILIDTPETKHPRLGVEPFGLKASNYTKKKLTGKKVQLETDVQQRDQYGRLLAYIWVNGRMFNEELINKGLARVAVFPPNTKYINTFRDLQSNARKKKIGIWSIENYFKDRGYDTKMNVK
jgi:micrococcal nuclease